MFSLFLFGTFSRYPGCPLHVSEPWNRASLGSSTNKINHLACASAEVRRLSLWYHSNTLWLSSPHQWDSWTSGWCPSGLLGISFAMLSHCDWPSWLWTRPYDKQLETWCASAEEVRWSSLDTIVAPIQFGWVPLGFGWCIIAAGSQFCTVISYSPGRLLWTVSATEELLVMFSCVLPYMFMCVHVCVPSLTGSAVMKLWTFELWTDFNAVRGCSYKNLAKISRSTVYIDYDKIYGYRDGWCTLLSLDDTREFQW